VQALGVITRAFRNISRRKIRVLLVVIALGFSIAIMTSIPAGIVANQVSQQNIASNLSNMITQTEAALNQSLTEITCSLSSGFSGFGFRTPPSGGVTPPSGGFGGGGLGGFSFGASNMNESRYADISSISGVSDVVSILTVSEGTTQQISMFGRTFTRLVPQYVIEGLPLNSSLIDNYPILPTTIVSGTNLQGGDSGVVLLSENNTAYFNVGVGDSVTILGSTFKVVGVYGSSTASTSTSGLTLYMSLSDAQKITNNVGNITSIKVFANSSSYTTQLANAISSAYPELTVTTAQQQLSQLQSMQSQYSTALQSAEAAIAQTQSTAIEEIAVAVAATSLIVLVVMLYTVRERTKEIGILKAIGFSNWNIMSQFMLEGIIMSLIAGVVGLAIGSVGAPYLISFLLPRTNLSGTFGLSNTGGFTGTSMSQTVTTVISPEMMLLTFGAAALLGAVGSLYPAWRASRTSPMEALKYE
jgi:putative ABC transport system permease protein